MEKERESEEEIKGVNMEKERERKCEEEGER